MQLYHINKNVIIQPEQVVKVLAISNYSKIFMQNKSTITTAKVLHNLHEALGFNFIRINRSTLINKNSVLSLGKDTDRIILTTGEELAISRRRKKEILPLFNTYEQN